LAIEFTLPHFRNFILHTYVGAKIAVCHTGNRYMTLKTSQKKNLRTQVHHLKPVVTVADKGLSESVMAEIERALNDHELIKIKLRSDRDTRKAWAQSIAEQCQAELIQSIGQVSSFYRRNPDKAAINVGK
jgi:RNA-binding protein